MVCGRIRCGRPHDRALFQRRKNVRAGLRLTPAIHVTEIRDRLVDVETVDERPTQVLVREAERVPGLMGRDARELRLGGVHREALQVHGRALLRDEENVRLEIGPVARAAARDSDLARAVGQREGDAEVPRIHVLQDALLEVVRGRFEETNRKRARLPAPVFRGHQGQLCDGRAVIGHRGLHQRRVVGVQARGEVPDVSV